MPCLHRLLVTKDNGTLFRCGNPSCDDSDARRWQTHKDILKKRKQAGGKQLGLLNCVFCRSPMLNGHICPFCFVNHKKPLKPRTTTQMRGVVSYSKVRIVKFNSRKRIITPESSYDVYVYMPDKRQKQTVLASNLYHPHDTAPKP